MTGGALGGRRLFAPVGRSVRPTTDRVREALFARLGALDGARVLDLFAGTGALGIEALSRGAGEAVFVERARSSLQALARNLQALELQDRTRILRSDASAALAALGRRSERFDLVLLDPPYGPEEPSGALRALVAAGVLAPAATVVAERARRHPLGPVAGLVLVDERGYGDTVVSRLRPASAADPGDQGGRSEG